jgi:hypothetical protein
MLKHTSVELRIRLRMNDEFTEDGGVTNTQYPLIHYLFSVAETAKYYVNLSKLVKFSFKSIFN